MDQNLISSADIPEGMPTKFHQIWDSSFGSIVRDRETERQTDGRQGRQMKGQMDTIKTICLPYGVGRAERFQPDQEIWTGGRYCEPWFTLSDTTQNGIWCKQRDVHCPDLSVYVRGYSIIKSVPSDNILEKQIWSLKRKWLWSQTRVKLSRIMRHLYSKNPSQ